MKSILILYIALIASIELFAQSDFNHAKGIHSSEISELRESKKSSIPSYIKFKEDVKIPSSNFKNWLQSNFKLNQAIDFELINTFVDELGIAHDRYQQLYSGNNVKNAVWLVHSKNGTLISMNGLVYNSFKDNFIYRISESEALNLATVHIGAEKYKWQVPEEEKHLKMEQKNENATYFPTGKKVLFEIHSAGKSSFVPTYEFSIYAHSKLYHSKVYVNANSGEIVNEESIIHDADVIGTAQTVFSGPQQMTTDSFGGGFRLQESGRGLGIATYNLQQGTDYFSATDFVDADNNWNNVNANLDQYATDAHFGAEKTYDYYNLIHNRNSIDGAGFALTSYIHYDFGFYNAFWDGMRMTYGDGDGTTPPLTSLDICGHEITHGLTSYSAGLIYNSESGGLNESFSDIFGTAVEKYARPTNWDWLIAADLGVSFRSMSNPNAFGDPDTYHGDFWDFAEEVHNISGVQNHWFYLLSEGGSGTNDNNDTYSVTGIGVEDAAKVAFRNLTVYLTPSSDYADARFYSIIAAQDLFGGCTPKVEATTNAWYAVGVGLIYNPVTNALFSTNDETGCAIPFEATFQNLSTNAMTYTWDFGDGQTSTAIHPTHIYQNYGAYTVTLHADGGTCGSSTFIIPDVVTIEQTNVCFDILTPNESKTSHGCVGLLYDSGGPSATYSDMENSTFLIAPIGASTLTVNFNYFDLEAESFCSYDGLSVYDGPNNSSPLIGTYCGGNPPPASITSTGSSIFLSFYSDQSVVGDGFEISWTCISSQIPQTDFIASTTQSCMGNISFSDLSLFNPTSWIWDFGDGQTSNLQSPTHNYTAPGTYTIQLTASNANGSDIETKMSYIVIDDCLGMNEVTLSELNVYPNPTTDKLMINTSSNNSELVEIMDNSGRIIYSQHVSGSDFELSLNQQIVPGSYYIILRDSQKVLVGKTRFTKL